MNHGIVDALAFQEALLIEAAFGIAILAMIWVAFRRWLQHKEKMGRLASEETAESAAQYGALMQRVEARLNAIEQIVIDGSAKTPAQIGALGANPLPERILRGDESQEGKRGGRDRD